MLDIGSHSMSNHWMDRNYIDSTVSSESEMVVQSAREYN